MSLRIDSQSLGIVPDRPEVDSEKRAANQLPQASTNTETMPGDTTTLSLASANLQSSQTTVQDAQSAQELVSQTSALFQNSTSEAVAALGVLNPEDVQSLLS